MSTKSSSRKRGLGRGLNALLSNSESLQVLTEPQPGDELREVAIDLIHRGQWQPRIHFDEAALQELADSISAQGVVQPIVLRSTVEGQYEIVAGERRWRASQLAGLDTIPAVIKHFDDRTAAAVSLIENIQREDLNPMEESNALFRLMNEFEMTHQEIADTVARSRTMVTNLLRLQELNPDVKKMLSSRDIEMGHARALLGVSGQMQSQLARDVAKKGLSVRETEKLVRRMAMPAIKNKKMAADPDIKSLETRLSERLGASVRIHTQPNGKGRLEISYNSLDELEGILSKIQ